MGTVLPTMREVDDSGLCQKGKTMMVLDDLRGRKTMMVLDNLRREVQFCQSNVRTLQPPPPHQTPITNNLSLPTKIDTTLSDSGVV